jgi:poly(A) polymerase
MNAAERIADLLQSPGVARIFAVLDHDGGQARIIGGAVRNALLGRPVRDIDFATTLLPDAVMARCSAAGLRTLPTGIEHGTVTVLADRARFEVTTLRRDVETDGRRAVVAYSTSFEEDASRRDFTINQFSLSADGVVHDYAEALNDLAARRVRFIGDPESRIREDYLRILRFFRFHAEYGEGDPDGPGLAACIALRGGMGRLSAERIREELLKTLVAPGAGIVVPLLANTGIWHAAVPRVEPAPAAFIAAVSAFPHSDALARLVALAVRSREDAARLSDALRLSGAEARRLDLASQAVAGLQAEGLPVSPRVYRLVAIRLGLDAARDALGILAGQLGASVRELAELAIPRSPFRGDMVVARGVPAGPKVGAALELALDLWASADFPDDEAAQESCLLGAITAVGAL